jgi:probable F420-dependent oxidoreductase
MHPKTSVVLGLWQDRPPLEALATARLADRLGYEELWIGEMATFDAFAVATAIGLEAKRLALTIGPLAVSVRTPVTIAMGAASVAALTGKTVRVAIGSSSAVVVEEWHGRSRRGAAQPLAESATALSALLAGDRAEQAGRYVSTHGYRLRLDPPRSELTIAAFGPKAVQVAAAHAGRAVLNLVTPAATARVRAELDRAAAALGRKPVRLAVWLAAAVDPAPEATRQLRRAIVAYLAAPGYREMFAASGFGDVVEFARRRPHPRELLAAIPSKLCEAVALVGDRVAIEERIAEYAAAGADEICLVPATAADDDGERTLRALVPG